METNDAAARMAEAASAWLAALTPEQRARASFAFADEAERTDWAYFPRGHKGLPLLEQDPPQQKLAHALIASALSRHAYAKVCAIMSLESVLNDIEGRALDAMRDPGRYFLSVFDRPGGDVWSWRIEGHHVCLNVTIAGGAVVSPTPIFLGANPAEVRHGDTPVLRPCGEEEDRARDLLASLDGDQRGSAIICPVAPPDFVLTNRPFVPDAALPGEGAPPFLAGAFESVAQEHKEALRLSLTQPSGIAAAALDGRQRALLTDLIGVYVERLPEPLAARARADLERGGIERVHFAWAGEERPRRPHYYRLQGPSFLVEYDNTQNDANHVHAVWRDPANDFGRDGLRAHLRGAH